MSQDENEDINQIFFDACRVVEQRIKAGSFCIVAIGGAMGGGKTRLSQYLSFKFGLSLLETDHFLRPVETKVGYDYKCIQEILESKKKAKRHIIIEGCSILPVLSKFDPSEIFLIYIENKRPPGNPSGELIDWGNTEHCSIKEILDVDCQCHLKKLAKHTIRWIVNT